MSARWRGIVAWSAVAIALIALAASLLAWMRIADDNRIIAALARGDDVAVADDARDAVRFARVHWLASRDRFDEARPLVEHLAADGTPAFAAAALYDLANAHLRQALAIVGAHRYDDTIAQVNLAKQFYRRALQIDPAHWDAKVNLDIAMRLVRDFPDGEAEGDEEPPEQPDKLWTDLPGQPRGGP